MQSSSLFIEFCLAHFLNFFFRKRSVAPYYVQLGHNVWFCLAARCFFIPVQCCEASIRFSFPQDLNGFPAIKPCRNGAKIILEIRNSCSLHNINRIMLKHCVKRLDAPLGAKEKAPSLSRRRFAKYFRYLAFNQPIPMERRNSMLCLVRLSLLSNSSIASTGGTPVKARRSSTTRLYSSGW